MPSFPAVPVASEKAKKTPPTTTIGIKYETPVLNAFRRSFPTLPKTEGLFSSAMGFSSLLPCVITYALATQPAQLPDQ